MTRRIASVGRIVPFLMALQPARADAPQPIHVHADQIGVSGVVRVDWDVPKGVKVAYYEVVRKPPGDRPVARTAWLPATLVILDEPKANEGDRFSYTVTARDADGQVLAQGRGAFEAGTRRGEAKVKQDFDGGRLEGDWIVDGRIEFQAGKIGLGGGRRPDETTVRIERTWDTDSLDVTARVQVDSGAPDGGLPDDARPFVTIRLDPTGRAGPEVRLGLGRRGARSVAILSVQEPGKVAQEAVSPEIAPEPFVNGAWTWLKLRYDARTHTAVAWCWPDDGEHRFLEDRPLLALNCRGPGEGDQYRPVLVGSGSNAAWFGELLVETGTDIPAPRPAIAVRPPSGGASPDPFARARNGLTDAISRLGAADPTAHPAADRARPRRQPRLASVVRILKPGELDAEADSSQSLERLVPFPANARAMTQSTAFDTAARFPIPRSDAQGGSFEAEGMRIAEGMTFTASADGDFEVRMEAWVAATPVTMRLQLEVVYPSGVRRILTLPPIEVPPYKNSRDQYEHANYAVRYVGFSPEIQAQGIQWSRVERRGTARFGSYPTDESSPR